MSFWGQHRFKCRFSADSRCVVSTAVYVNDVTQSSQLVYDEEINIYDDVGSYEVTKREETQVIIPQWHMAMRPG